MANPEHLARLHEGKRAWNVWRENSPDAMVSLEQADIANADLTGMNLDLAFLEGANLSGAILHQCNLRNAKLEGANLTHANLREANLEEARMFDANLGGACFDSANLKGAFVKDSKARDATFIGSNLAGADLTRVDFGKSNLSGADLTGAMLPHANLAEANLRAAVLDGADLWRANLNATDLTHAVLQNANLQQARLRFSNLKQANLKCANAADVDFYGAILVDANLLGADLRSARLQGVALDGANMTEARMWETQRARWRIKDVICQCIFWDQDGSVPTCYAPGEFERLYSEQTSIELFYQGGVSSFELNTLPALLHHLASLSPGSNIRLKSIEEAGDGAKISISIGDTDTKSAEKIKADAVQVYHAQLVLREKETERLQIEKDYLERLFLGKLIPAVLNAGTPQNVFNAPVTGIVISSGESKVDFRQTVNDNAALLALLEKIIDRQADLNLAASEASQLSTELHSAKAELTKPNPDPTTLSKSIAFIQKLATEAVTRAAGKLGEQIVSGEWQTWLHQLSQYVAHLR